MRKVTKYGRKLKWVYIKSAMVITAAMIVAFPWFKGFASTEEGYYSVVLNGDVIGAVNDASIANDAYLEARMIIESENDASVYLSGNLEIVEEDRLYGKKSTKEELVDKMYDVLCESSVEVKERAYVVNIEGFMVTLSTKEEVVALLDAAKSKYDPDGQFTTVLTDAGDSRFSYISYDFVNLGMETRATNTVTAAEGETSDDQYLTAEEEDADGLKALSFSEDVEIIETYVSKSQVNTLDEAIELVTKEKEEEKIYEVVSGDTLSSIARNYDLTLDQLLAMNPDYDENGYILIGDRITVTVPEPELSVVTTERKTYEESYELPVEYVYNNSQYTTYSAVISYGSTGYRQVVADVTYVNGIEESRDIISEVTITQAVAKVVEVGTITPPTFIKPVSGGYISCGWGGSGGTHWAIDWAVNTGTSVVASCAGTVTFAGWAGASGYCVIISHGNGITTKYGHLSQILVTVGQYVKQGEIIARSGSTGFSTGPHLHFEILVYGVKKNPLDYLN